MKTRPSSATMARNLGEMRISYHRFFRAGTFLFTCRFYKAIT
jgi:hypothetical protein